MSLVLAIETSNPSAGSVGVALGRAGSAVTSVPLKRGGDEELMPAIAQMLNEAGAGPADLERVGVSIGPGGFTGVRIAVAAAKMICETTGAACVGVPSARVVARRVSNDGRPFAVALASKRESAHLTVFDVEGTARGDGSILLASDLEGLGIGRLIADEHLARSFCEEAARLGVGIERPVFDPVACLELAIEGNPVDPIALAPFYPREPEAVTRWRELHPGQ